MSEGTESEGEEVGVPVVRRGGALGEVRESTGVLRGVNTAESELAVSIVSVAPALGLEVDTENLGALIDRK